MTPKEKVESKRTSPGERRRQAMVDAAYSLFIEKGYESVTVDDIIKVSGGSKSSLYKFFSTKEGILKAVVESLADEMLEEIMVPEDSKKSVKRQIKEIGLSISGLALSDNAINQFRLAVQNAKERPDLASIWYTSGPKRTFDGFAQYLKNQADAGKLKIKDPERAALFFFGMIVFKGHITMSVGAPAPARKEQEAVVDEAVEVFLAAYGC